MWSLAWSAIKTAKGRFAGAFIAVLGASVLIGACGILLQSGLGAGVPAERFAGASVVVAAEQSVSYAYEGRTTEKPVGGQVLLPAEVAEQVRAVPGVAEAVGEYTFPAGVVTPDGTLLSGPDGRPSLGHGWASAVLAPFTFRSGRPPAAPGEVVLDAELAQRAGVAEGARVRVAAGTRVDEYLVTGIVAPPDADGLARQSTVFFSDAHAAELTGDPGRVDAVGVIAQPDVDEETLAERIMAALSGTGAVTYTGDEAGQAEFLDVAQARQALQIISSSLGGVAMLIAMFVVAATLALAVQQRRREFAMLRAIAATPRQIYQMIACEAGIVSLAAGLIGCLPGIAVAAGLRAALASAGAIPADFQFSIGPIPLLAAVVLVVVAAEAAALTAARRATKISPVEALGEAAVERTQLGLARRVIAWFFVTVGVAGAFAPLFVGGVFASPIATAAGLFLIIGVCLFGPRVARKATDILSVPLRGLSRVGGFLAAANTRANSRRLAAAITPLVLGISFTALIVFYNTTQAAGATRQSQAGTAADYVLSSAGAGLPPDAVLAVRAVPGVAAATGVVRGQVLVAFDLLGDPEIDPFTAQGVTAEGLPSTLDLGLREGSFAGLSGDTVALSASLASTVGATTGSTVQLYLGDGTRITPTVVAVYERGLGFGDVTLPHDTLIGHTVNRLDDAILVRTEPGADLTVVGESLRELQSRYPGLIVADRDAFAAAQQVQQDVQAWVSYIPLGLILAYIAIAVANTLVMTTGERTREFALLRLVGATRRQVMRMVGLESVVVVAIAVVVGSVLPVLPLAVVSFALTGNPIPVVPGLVYLGIVVAAAVLGTVSMVVPTRLTLTLRPVDAARIRE